MTDGGEIAAIDREVYDNATVSVRNNADRHL